MTPDDTRISRRTALTATGAAVLATAVVSSPAAAQSETYVDHETVGYQPEPYTQICTDCIHWDSRCRVVHDATDPNGWCQAYTAA
jgi:anaerobic selenocysteine-containing dehydrogenase